MKKLLILLPVAALLGACNSGPRDATNDPEVQAMIKGVNEQGKMPGAEGGAPQQKAPEGGAAPAGGAPSPAPGGN